MNAGASPLQYACQNGHPEVVRTLLSAGAEVNPQNEDGFSPLHAACQAGHREVVHALLSAGANVNLQAKGGCSPLQMACHSGDMEVVRALLSVGAKVDLQATDGMTPLQGPLHVACMKGTDHPYVAIHARHMGWSVPCYQLEPNSTCRARKVLHPCMRLALLAT